MKKIYLIFVLVASTLYGEEMLLGGGGYDTSTEEAKLISMDNIEGNRTKVLLKSDKYSHPITKSMTEKINFQEWITLDRKIMLKADGSLWEAKKKQALDLGQIVPVEEQKKEKKGYLKPQKIGEDFSLPLTIHAQYHIYAIKKDGTLWGWGEDLSSQVKQIGKSHNWMDFNTKLAGNGCCAYDIGVKDDGTLWRFPEFFDYSRQASIPEPKQISTHHWNKILLGCCSIYGQREDGSLWSSYEEDNQSIFIPFQKEKLFAQDKELLPLLDSKLNSIEPKTIYNPME